MNISVIIPTYQREQVLLDTLAALIKQAGPGDEILVMDQTLTHEPGVDAQLAAWDKNGSICWIRLPEPSITRSMNLGAAQAKTDLLLFLDDDIVPDGGLLKAHKEAYEGTGAPGEFWAVAGRITQPWQSDEPRQECADGKGKPGGFDTSTARNPVVSGGAKAPLSINPEQTPAFGPGCVERVDFNSTGRCYVSEAMAGNLSVLRSKFLEIGGFDENFKAVAYRFEKEFAERLVERGGKILFEPAAKIRHLQTARGGVRFAGMHGRSFLPYHSVGEYYYFFRSKKVKHKLLSSFRRLFGSVCTKHHLFHPWYIPATLIAETGGFFWGLSLSLQGPRLLKASNIKKACHPRATACEAAESRRVAGGKGGDPDSGFPIEMFGNDILLDVPKSGKIKLAVFSPYPIQYYSPWFRGLARTEGIDFKVCYGFIPGEAEQGHGFNASFKWDVPVLDGYKWEVVPNARKNPGFYSFLGSSTPGIKKVFEKDRPDAVVLIGWSFLPLLQALWACRKLRIPTVVRGDSNNLKKRNFLIRLIHRSLIRKYNAFLAVGKLNKQFYLDYGVPEDSIFQARHFVDNGFFESRINEIRDSRTAIRAAWNIPQDAACFLFAGKLETKKRIFDLLSAFEIACNKNISGTNVSFPPRFCHSRESGNPDRSKPQRESSPGSPIEAFGDDSIAPIHLLIAGDGEHMRGAKDLVAQKKLPVTFAGFLNQTEIVKAYLAADCLVLPSDYGETWGLVVNEAMACGLPAIVSDRVGCGPDLIIDGVTGYIFPFGDITALAGKLLECASPDKTKLIQMGVQAKALIANYSTENTVKGALEAVKYVLKARA